MSFEKQDRAKGRRVRPAAPVEIGVRARGKTKKLTPFISMRGDMAPSIFGQDFLDAGGYSELLVGKGRDAGKVRILKSSAEDSNAKIRKPTKDADEYIIETTLIPFTGAKSVKRTKAAYAPIENGMDIILPWEIDANRTERKEEGYGKADEL